MAELSEQVNWLSIEDGNTLVVDGVKVAREVFTWLSDMTNNGKVFRLVKRESDGAVTLSTEN